MENNLERLSTELRIRGFSQKTIQAYVFHTSQFLEYIQKTPSRINEEDIKQYLNFLITTKSYKHNSINLVVSSLEFFFRIIVNKSIVDNIPRHKIKKKVPSVLTKGEANKLVESIDNIKHKILIKLMLSSGLRVSEAVSLRVEDLNFEENTITVISGKGEQGRISIMSDSLKEDIKQYLETRKITNRYLFSSKRGHISIKLPQKIIKEAAQKAKIIKNVYCHMLRATFATQLLNNGVDIRIIQTLLGHANLDTTQIYTRVSRKQLTNVKSPF